MRSDLNRFSLLILLFWMTPTLSAEDKYLTTLIYRYIYSNEELCGDPFADPAWLPAVGQCSIGCDSIQYMCMSSADMTMQTCRDLPQRCVIGLRDFLGWSSTTAPPPTTTTTRRTTTTTTPPPPPTTFFTPSVSLSNSIADPGAIDETEAFREDMLALGAGAKSKENSSDNNFEEQTFQAIPEVEQKFREPVSEIEHNGYGYQEPPSFIIETNDAYTGRTIPPEEIDQLGYDAFTTESTLATLPTEAPIFMTTSEIEISSNEVEEPENTNPSFIPIMSNTYSDGAHRFDVSNSVMHSSMPSSRTNTGFYPQSASFPASSAALDDSFLVPKKPPMYFNNELGNVSPQQEAATFELIPPAPPTDTESLERNSESPREQSSKQDESRESVKKVFADIQEGSKKDLSKRCCEWALNGLCDRSWQKVRNICAKSCGSIICEEIEGVPSCMRIVNVDVEDCFQSFRLARYFGLRQADTEEDRKVVIENLVKEKLQSTTHKKKRSKKHKKKKRVH